MNGGPIERIVNRTREMEVPVEQFLDSVAVFVDVGLQARTSDAEGCVAHL